MTKYILNIIENPTLRELHNTAFSFSVLESNNLPKSWILENFSVLKYNQTLSKRLDIKTTLKKFKRKIFIVRKFIHIQISIRNKRIH